jgi:hypothetical protein
MHEAPVNIVESTHEKLLSSSVAQLRHGCCCEATNLTSPPLERKHGDDGDETKIIERKGERKEREK